jgi:hypothetical protein
VAVLWENIKVIRRGLQRKNPDPWEVYDLARDPGEKKNLADTMGESIKKSEALLREQISENTLFPVSLPGN